MIATTGKAEVIERLAFEKYNELPGVRSSGLREMLVSPLQYQYQQMCAREDSDTLRAGRAAHTAILEPDRFLREYAEWETLDRDGKKRIRRGGAWDEFQTLNAGKTILTPSQFRTALALRDVVRDHPVAGPLVKGIGMNELSLRWRHERTGLDVKARIDRLTKNALIDIKTTRDHLPHSFSATAERLGYFMQMAIYSEGVKVALGVEPAVKIIAIRNVEPFDVAVYDVELDALEHGLQQYNEALDKVIACQKSQRWPGFAETTSLPLRRPAWTLNNDDVSDINFGGAAVIGE